MRSTIIITSILFAAVIAAAVFYFSDLGGGGQSKQKALALIPDDAVFLTAFDNDPVVAEIFTGFELFQAVLGDDHYRRLTYIRQTMLRQEQLASLTAGQEIVVAFHAGGSGIDYLIALPVTERLSPRALFEAISAAGAGIEPQWVDSVNRKVIRLHLPENIPPLYVTEVDGVLLASFSEELLDRAVDKKTPKLTAETIQHFRRGSNENAPLTWYINHNRLGKLTHTLTRGKPGNFLRLLEGMTGFSALHMNFRSDAFMFSGNSDLTADTSAYLSLYAQQRPVEQSLKNLLPANTAIYISFGISDFAALHGGIADLLARRDEISQIREQHRLIRQSPGMSIQEELLPEWGNEFAVAELSNGEELAIIEVRDSLSFARTIQRISTPYPQNMYRLNHSNLLYYSFGDPLKSFTRPYFTVLGNYMICANHTRTLQQFEAEYTAGKTLATTPRYRNFEAMQANKSNFTLFVSNENAARTIARGLRPNFEAAYTDEAHYGYHNFYGWSVQMSGTGNGFFTHVYGQYIAETTPGATPAWTFTLNGRLSSVPAVLAYDDTSRFILAQDASHILHAIAADGQKLWNAQLPGPLLGEIHQLADSSIVVTTATRLYRFDVHGDPLPGFSLPLPYQASHGATVSENANDVRFFIPAKNRIMAYDARGKPLQGWENKTLTGAILFDLKTADVGNVSYIIAATDAGRRYFFQDNGRQVSVQENGAPEAWRNPVSVYTAGGQPEHAWTATTDTSGRLFVTAFDFLQSDKSVGQWTTQHTFDAVNIEGASTPELVFTDEGQLSVYRYEDGSPVYHYDFKRQLASRPQFFRLADGTHRIGIATGGNQLIYVFNTDGTVVKGFPVSGSPYFYYGLLNGGQHVLLCSKNDRNLYCYRF